jgi:tetratricopeptide (TPR) repeat protein
MAAALVLGAPLVAARTPAQQALQMIGCLGQRSSISIGSCTALIESGKLSTPDLAVVYEARGAARAATGDERGGLTDLSQAIELDPGLTSAVYARALLRSGLGDNAGGIADMTLVIERQPTADAVNNRGLMRAELGDLDGALVDTSRAIELEPDNAHFHTSRGRIKAERRDPGAKADLDRAVELDPGSYSALFIRAGVRSVAGDHAGSIEDLDRALELNPQSHEALTNRGQSRWYLREYDAARKDLDAAIELAPLAANAYANRALVAMSQKRLDAAMADISYALTLAPGHAELYNLRAAVEELLGDRTAAEASVTRAIDLAPSTIRYYNRGVLRSNGRDFDRALSDFREALSMNPNNDWAALRIWMIRARMGARDEATAELRATIARRRSAGAPGWVMTIADFLVGHISEADLIKEAESTGAAAARRQSQAFFYAGWVKLLENDAGAARALFEKAVAADIDYAPEYSSAVAELARLR